MAAGCLLASDGLDGPGGPRAVTRALPSTHQPLLVGCPSQADGPTRPGFPPIEPSLMHGGRWGRGLVAPQCYEGKHSARSSAKPPPHRPSVTGSHHQGGGAVASAHGRGLGLDGGVPLAEGTEPQPQLLRVGVRVLQPHLQRLLQGNPHSGPRREWVVRNGVGNAFVVRICVGFDNLPPLWGVWVVGCVLWALAQGNGSSPLSVVSGDNIASTLPEAVKPFSSI